MKLPPGQLLWKSHSVWQGLKSKRALDLWTGDSISDTFQDAGEAVQTEEQLPSIQEPQAQSRAPRTRDGNMHLRSSTPEMEAARSSSLLHNLRLPWRTWDPISKGREKEKKKGKGGKDWATEKRLEGWKEVLNTPPCFVRKAETWGVPQEILQDKQLVNKLLTASEIWCTASGQAYTEHLPCSMLSCMHRSYICRCPMRQSCWIPGTRVTCGCESSYIGAGNQTQVSGLLKEQQAFNLCGLFLNPVRLEESRGYGTEFSHQLGILEYKPAMNYCAALQLKSTKHSHDFHKGGGGGLRQVT